jgi:RecA-family ATPase
MRVLAYHFGGDPAVADVSRLMRLPGSLNWKYGEPRPVLVSLKGEALIDIWDEQVGSGLPVLQRRMPSQSLGPTPGAQDAAPLDANAFEAYAAAAVPPPVDVEARLAAMDWHGAGDASVHATQLSVTASLLNAGLPRDEVVEQVLASTMTKPYANQWNANTERRTLEGMCDTWLTKTAQPNGPAVETPSPNGEDFSAQRREADPHPQRLPPLPFIDISKWDQNFPPPQEWAVPEVIPTRQPTLFTGIGGGGKSILELQLVVAHVLKRNWLGFTPEPGPVIYLGAEDDEEGLERRINAIAAAYEAKYADLIHGGLHLLSYAGEDCQLAVASRRTGLLEPTKLFTRLHEAARDIKPKHIGLDTSADVFGGNEIDRVQVRQFCALLRKLAITADGTVMLLGHPSLTGVSTGTGISGSTAWHNSVRARMYLKSLDQQGNESSDEEEDPPADTPRKLEFKKNQYGKPHKSIILHYKQGVFIPADAAADSHLFKLQVDEHFLVLLRRLNSQGRNVSPEKSPTFAPAVFADQPDARFSRKDFARAMERLLNDKRVHVVVEGPISHRRSRLREADPS